MDSAIVPDISFILGLCAALGRNESFLISTGFAGAKVKRLANGLKVGQTVTNQGYIIAIVSQFLPVAFLASVLI